MTWRSLAACAAATLLATSCTSDDAPSALDTGAPTDARVSDLSSDERRAVCEAVQSWGRERLQEPDATHTLCLLQAALFSSFTLDATTGDDDATAACAERYDECIEQEPSLESDEMTCEADQLAECDYTVEELETCLASSLELTFDYFDGFTCDDLAADTPADAFDEPDTEEVCPDVMTRCSALTESGDPAGADFNAPPDATL